MTRAADPYRETSVIDARAPRFNQAVIGILSLVAVTVGPWWLLALLAIQLIVGLTLGRRWCLQCIAYFELVQPRFGEGPLEDARPPRFANLVGAVFLSAASLAFLAGWDAAGTALGALVAALALLASITGFCAGCEVYKLGYRLIGKAVRLLPAAAAAGAELALALSRYSVGWPTSFCTLAMKPVSRSKNSDCTVSQPPRSSIVKSEGGVGKSNVSSTAFETGR